MHLYKRGLVEVKVQKVNTRLQMDPPPFHVSQEAGSLDAPVILRGGVQHHDTLQEVGVLEVSSDSLLGRELSSWTHKEDALEKQTQTLCSRAQTDGLFLTQSVFQRVQQHLVDG